MVKYFCDRCEKEVRKYQLNLVIYVKNERDEYSLCDNCLKEFEKLIKNF